MLRSCIINQAAWRHNIQLIRSKFPSQRILLPIKADAYGHGMEIMVNVVDNSVDAYWVSTIEEAIQLRTMTDKRICVSQFVASHADLEILLSLSCDLVVFDVSQIQLFQEKLLCFKHIWLKLNTGMNRLGIPWQEYDQAITALNKISDQLSVGVLTHLADGKESTGNNEQLKRFKDIASRHDEVSWSSSSGLLWREIYHCGNWIRPGILIHGIMPISTDTDKNHFRPVMSLYAQIIQLQKLNIGDSVGYERSWISSQKSIIATVSLGYADGLPQYAHDSKVIIRGQACPIIGYVSMDLLTVDVSHVINASIGDEVEIFGNIQSINRFCDDAKISPYFLISRLGHRIRRSVIDE